jgi:phenylalanyl-tRNA synthetase beta chain
MRVSLNTLKRYTEITMPIDGLVAQINAQLGGVESVTDLGARYKDAVIVTVTSCTKHPNADKLNVCLVDDDGKVPDVPRDSNGLVQVVCGAPNVRAGLSAVWLPPGSTVPASYEEAEPFVLGARELRGVLSQGMLASPQELALGDSHDGILEVTDGVRPGTAFATQYGLDDTLIDIENKMFTHRPDCFGQLGVAREIAGISHRAFTSPDWYRQLPDFQSGEGLKLDVSNEIPELVPRFMAVALRDVVIKPSPLWLQTELIRLGSKPINNVVDATNYVMLLTAQPTHAYDYTKLRGARLGARLAVKGETVTLLNHKTYDLTPEDIVIVDGSGPVGLAGVMGGGESEVSSDTTDIVLECATFDMYAVRKSSMRHGVFTDALTRFNKGQSPLQNAQALALLVQLIQEIAGGELATHVFDDSAPLEAHKPLRVTAAFINERLGLTLTADECAVLLRNVEFVVETKGDSLAITPPFWRTDIGLEEDIVEEIGRLYGFDKLPRILPMRPSKPTPTNRNRELKRLIRESLIKSGGNEVLTYSFVDEKLIERAGQAPTDAYRLSNALSPQLQYFRLSVLPSLLDKVHTNIKAGYGRFMLFEIGKGHDKRLAMNEEALPAEIELIEAVYVSKTPQDGAPFYAARRVADQLLADLAISDVAFVALDPAATEGTPFEPSRTAAIQVAGASRCRRIAQPSVLISRRSVESVK